MTFAVKYNTSVDYQISEIRKFANKSIVIIWIAGTSLVLLFIFYFIFFSIDAGNTGKISHEVIGISKQQADAAVFSDKTTLVNIGLKIQAMSENADVKSNGSIRIHKIKYDQQLNKVVRSSKPTFTVKAVPK